MSKTESPYVLITGAAGGIGQALVQEFTQQKYQVIATDIKPKPPDLECAYYFQVDLEKTVNDEKYADNLFLQIKGQLDGKGLHALINNAAVQILGGVDNLSRESWQRTLNINLLAPFIWTQSLIQELEQSKGCVVNISSIHARLTKSNFVAYATSKAALSGMTRALAVDVGSRIRVNAIEPAAIDTEMLLKGFQGKTDLYEKVCSLHPQKTIGSPLEVAKLCFAMAGKNIPFLNGSCVAVDGGISSCLMDPD